MTPALLPQINPAVPLLEPGPALRAYERCAHYYDLLTADYDHDAWLASVHTLASEAGFAGDRVLDVACGTGKSAAPMVRRGYRVSACDLSPAMVRRARLRLGGGANVFVADMRRLPDGRAVDLLTCLDDALNYLLSFEDLVAAMAGFARALAPGGVAVFDTNTTSTYREMFADGCEFELAGGSLCWHGRGRSRAGHFTAQIEPVPGSGQTGRPSVHVQRHHAREEVAAACGAAGLEIVKVLGQSTGCVYSERIDEDQQSKLLYVVRRAREEVAA
jgi:SAM-dependent methyltransferase